MKQQEFIERFGGELIHGIIYYEGNLDLQGKQINTLPDNLTVEGSLYLRGTQVKKIPRNLMVKDRLFLHRTQITFLPCDLTVGGVVFGFEGDQSQVNRNSNFREKMLQDRHLTIKKTSPSFLTQGNVVCFDPKGTLHKVYINNDSKPCIHYGVQIEIRKDVYKVISKPLVMGIIDMTKEGSDKQGGTVLFKQ